MANRRIKFFSTLLISALSCILNSATLFAGSGNTSFGFTPFYFDLTTSAIEQTHHIVEKYGNLYALHFDNGIPWHEALHDKPFPDKLQREWEGLRRRKPAFHKVYLGLAPVAKDRKTVSPSCEGSLSPWEKKPVYFDNGKVKKAYLNYVKKAVNYFEPDYLNLGIEAGEVAHRDKKAWKQFSTLYRYVRTALKKSHPDLQVGISFGLHTLMTDKKVAKSADALLKDCDFIGVSFYPYMSQFHEKFGAKPLVAPPGQWTDALDWLASFTNKPIAVCETGYNVENVSLPKYDIKMKGNSLLQKQYVRDLVKIARRDAYLFVVWFLPIDYDALYEKLPVGDGTNRIWRNIGLFDKNLKPRPALKYWQSALTPLQSTERAIIDISEKTRDANKVIPQGEKQASVKKEGVIIGFTDRSDLFTGPAYDKWTIDNKGPLSTIKSSMKWSFDYKKGRWQWCTKDIQSGQLDKDLTKIKFWVRSDRAGTVLVEITENGGEAFFAVLNPTTEWALKEISFDALLQQDEKKKNGKLEIEKGIKILIADEAGASKKRKGHRDIWFAKWQFE